MLCVYISRGCCVAFTDCKVLCVDHMNLVRCHAQEAVRGRVFLRKVLGRLSDRPQVWYAVRVDASCVSMFVCGVDSFKVMYVTSL